MILTGLNHGVCAACSFHAVTAGAQTAQSFQIYPLVFHSLFDTSLISILHFFLIRNGGF